MSDPDKEKIEFIKKNYHEKLAELTKARDVLISDYTKKLEENKIAEIQNKIKQLEK
jgi:uncharacterized protein YutE (UPF0331/DUF86 family)